VLSYITIIHFLSINQTVVLLSNKTCNILKRLWRSHGFYGIKPETEGNTDITPLTGDSRTRPISLLKSQFSHDLQIVGNISDIVSTQLNKIYNTSLVFFGYFTAKI